MSTPPGYAMGSYELRHVSMTRSAFITFGFDYSDPDPVALASGLYTAFSVANSLFTCIDSNVTMVASRVSVGTDGGGDIVGINTASKPCTAVLGSLPPNCAVLVHKRTNRGGRRGRGRMFIPWAASGVSTSEAGIVVAADATRVQNAVDQWKASMAAGPGPLVLLHRDSEPGTAHPTAPGLPDPVTFLSVDTLISTQRRRLGR